MRVSAETLRGPVNSAGINPIDDWNWFTQNRIVESDPRVIKNADGSIDIPDQWMDSGGGDWTAFMMAGIPIAGIAGAVAAAGAGAAGAAGAGAAAGADGAFAAGAMGGAAGPSFGGLTAAEAAGGAWGGAGAAGGGGWDYGEFLNSIGVDPASTQFSGGTMSNADIMSQIGASGMTPSTMSQVQSALKNGSSAKSIADALGLSEGAVSLLGKLGATALGMFGSNKQANSLEALANKYQEYGAPSRARFEASMTPGFDPMSIPGYSGAVDTASKGLLARLSATGGNPYGNPGGMIEANKSIISGTALPAINEYQRLNANTGYGSSMNAALNLDTSAIGADRGITTALASGIGDLTAPDNSLAALLKKYQGGGFQQNYGLT